MSEFLTTKEVAHLLRLKERKVYDLASRGEIPCVKATGKLLFPQAEIHHWIQHKGGSFVESATRPSIILGSHDPVFEWAIGASGSGLASMLNGSIDGLERYRAREGIVCGGHLENEQDSGWNLEAVREDLAQTASVLMHWAKRERGLIVKPGSGIQGFSDIRGRKFVRRQAEAGAQKVFESRLQKYAMSIDDLDCVREARTETEAAPAIVEGQADVTFGLRCFASRYNLQFVSVCVESFDLVIDRYSYFEPQIQALIRFTGSETFQAEASRYEGYDISELGLIRLNGAP